MAHRCTVAFAMMLLIGNGWAGEPPAQALADGVVLIQGGFEAGRQPDGNTVVLEGDDGLVLRYRSPSRAFAEILDFAAKSGSPIVAVVNSHWHLDHISGNPRLRAAYPALTVYASPAIDEAMSGFLANSRKQALQFLEQPGDPVQQADVRADVATIESGKAVYPDINITRAGERSLAGRALRIGFEANAVTGGDVWLYDTATGTLAAGDLVTLPAPFFDTACPPRWGEALARLQAVDFERLVPGHGPVMDRKMFETYKGAFDKLVHCAASKAEPAACRDGWIADAAPLLGDDKERKLAGMLLDYYLSTVLRDEEKQAGLCAADLSHATDRAAGTAR